MKSTNASSPHLSVTNPAHTDVPDQAAWPTIHSVFRLAIQNPSQYGLQKQGSVSEDLIWPRRRLMKIPG